LGVGPRLVDLNRARERVVRELEAAIRATDLPRAGDITDAYEGRFRRRRRERADRSARPVRW
jgi:hypothetical protein